jgi:hypothetical protein
MGSSTKNVFVSSVMRDFAPQRIAARAAVESLRQKPIMAEDFGAKPYSSQVACLEGVRQSDIYAGIIGPHYGFVTKAGISVTEEEFDEARKRGLPILWFIQKGSLDPEQQAFFDRIRGYEEGYFVDFFDNPNELQTKMTRSLFDYIGDPDSSNLESDGASSHVTKYLKAHAPFPEHAILTAIIFPSRQNETYLSPLDLGQKEIKESIMQRAFFGTGAILRPSLATKTVEGEHHLAFIQFGVHNRLATSIEIHCNGTLHLDTALGMDGNRDPIAGFMAGYVVDEDEVGNCLTAFFGFANGFYATLDASARLSSFYAAIFLRNMTYKSFGHRPKSPVSSMAMPMNSLPEPMIIPSKPLKVARSELNEGEVLAKKFVAYAERAFKAQNRYYGPK